MHSLRFKKDRYRELRSTGYRYCRKHSLANHDDRAASGASRVVSFSQNDRFAPEAAGSLSHADAPSRSTKPIVLGDIRNRAPYHKPTTPVEAGVGREEPRSIGSRHVPVGKARCRVHPGRLVPATLCRFVLVREYPDIGQSIELRHDCECRRVPRALSTAQGDRCSSWGPRIPRPRIGVHTSRTRNTDTRVISAHSIEWSLAGSAYEQGRGRSCHVGLRTAFRLELILAASASHGCPGPPQ